MDRKIWRYKVSTNKRAMFIDWIGMRIKKKEKTKNMVIDFKFRVKEVEEPKLLNKQSDDMKAETGRVSKQGTQECR